MDGRNPITMKKVRKSKKVGIGLALWACFIALDGWRAHAALNVTWDGGGGDYLFSNPTNWVGDALPATGDKIIINANTSAAHPALVDSGYTATPGNVNFQASGGTYVEILSGAAFKFSGLLNLGNTAGTYGELTVGNGGTLYNVANSGSVDIGLTGGKLTLNAGGTAELPNLVLRSAGTIEYISSSTGLATANLYGDNSWIMDGLLKVDLTALSSCGTFVLLQHDNDNSAAESMTGNLRTWLDAGSGTRSGTGSGIFSVNGTNVFEVIGTDRTGWVLSYDESSGSGKLVLNVNYIPAARMRLLLISFLNVLYPIRLP